MKNHLLEALENSISIKKNLFNPKFETEFNKVAEVLKNVIKSGNKVLFCGNGGSASDSQHLAAELIVRLRPNINRKALAGLALNLDSATITACGNDFGYEHLFERNLNAIGNSGDFLFCMSTSGNSENVRLAALAAKKMNIEVCGLLGSDGGALKKFCNYKIIIPSNITARIQECHMLIGHALIEKVEDELIDEKYLIINNH